MSSGYVQLPQDGTGKQVECDVVDGLYRQVVECHPADTFPVSGPLTDAQLRATSIAVTTNGAFGELTSDAWGIPKVSLPHSLFHGLFTFDIPAAQLCDYLTVTVTATTGLCDVVISWGEAV